MIFSVCLFNMMNRAIFQELLAAWFVTPQRPCILFSVFPVFSTNMKINVNVDYIPGKQFPFSRVPFQVRGMAGLTATLLQQPSEDFH